MKAVIVVPTIREDNINRFLRSWENEFRNHEVIILEDHPEPSFDIKGLNNFDRYCWQDIKRDFGDREWIVSKHTSAIKSYGVWLASQRSCDMIIILDDDCYKTGNAVPGGFVEGHWQVFQTGVETERWVNTITGLKARGLPYNNLSNRIIPVLNHGLWLDNPDVDAVTQLTQLSKEKYDNAEINIAWKIIPRGSYFPMCGMNVAFLPKMAPLMYFGLQGQLWGYDRFDDIWCGIFMKKVCDHLGMYISSGHPVVRHAKASNMWRNLEKEAPGLEVNETLWEQVDSVQLTSSNVAGAYKELGEKLPMEGDYWNRLKEAMQLWAGLFMPGTN